MGQTTWEVSCSGPGPGLSGHRATKSKDHNQRKRIGKTSPNKGDTDMYLPVSRPGIDVPPSRRFCRTEVTAYEGLEHSVPSVRHDATIQGMR